MLRLNALGPDGLIDRKAPGQRSRLDDRHRTALAAMVEDGPILAVHGVVRWRIIDLCQWVWDEFEISVSKQTLSRELRAMGYRKLSARPRHREQPEGAPRAGCRTLCFRQRRQLFSRATVWLHPGSQTEYGSQAGRNEMRDLTETELDVVSGGQAIPDAVVPF